MADFIKKARKLERRGELIRAAEMYVLGGEHEKAIEIYVKENLFLKAAKLCERTGKMDQAAEYYGKIGDFYHAAEILKRAGDTFQAGQMFKRAKRYREAAEMMEFSGVFSESARLYEMESNYLEAAERYLKAEMFQSAALCYEKAATHESPLQNTFRRPPSEDPHLRTILRKSAESWLRVPDFQRAAQLYEQLMIWDRAGEVYEQAGQPEKALECFRKGNFSNETIRLLRILNRQDQLIKYSLKQTGVHGDPLAAAKMADSQHDPSTAAEYYEKAGNFKEAAVRYEQVGDYMLSAEMFFRCGDYRQAAKMYELAGNIETAADLYDKLNINDKAIQLHIKSKNYSRAARLHLDARQNEDALRLLLRAGDQASTLSLRTLLAIAYFRLDKIDKGIEQVKDIISIPISMDTIEVQYEYACALYEQGNFNQAMEIFQSIVSLSKDYKKARQYLNWIAAVNEEVQAELGETIVGELPIGLIINNRYELLKLIGKGAVGIVYQAADRELNLSVALKILRPKYSYDPDIIEMIKREVTLARLLAHPNIIKIYDLNRAGNIWFVSMEYLQGEELKQRLLRQGPFAFNDLKSILDQIIKALIHSHQSKVIHADIKPANIFINKNNQITLVDFGIARAAGSLSSDTMVSGTPEYISPEQIHGDPPTAQSDLYSLGVTLYELATGQLPFKAPDMKKVLDLQINYIPPPPIEVRPDIPQWLNHMIIKLMKKNPLERYENAQAVQKDLLKTN